MNTTWDSPLPDDEEPSASAGEERHERAQLAAARVDAWLREQSVGPIGRDLPVQDLEDIIRELAGRVTKSDALRRVFGWLDERLTGIDGRAVIRFDRTGYDATLQGCSKEDFEWIVDEISEDGALDQSPDWVSELVRVVPDGMELRGQSVIAKESSRAEISRYVAQSDEGAPTE